jgi:thymidylate synthase
MAHNISVVETDSLGQCWLRVSGLILDEGQPGRYDGAATRELTHLSLVVEHPDSKDPVIGRHGDPVWLAWMHENFFIQKEVAELGRADSYAVRLFNYAHQGRDQIQWVVDRLRDNPESRSAAITTFAPLTDTSYIPCVSLLDFWIPGGQVELVVYAHSLDFGKKAYGNLVELALLQAHVAEQLGRPVGRLIIHVKSAHIYEPEWELMQGICQAEGITPGMAYR